MARSAADQQERDVSRNSSPHRAKYALILAAASYIVLLAWGLSREHLGDLNVYWWQAHDFFRGLKPMYGEDSGTLWPMNYRYPPVFVLLVYPLTWIPLPVANRLWVLMEWTAIGAASIVAIRKWKLRYTPLTVLATAILLGPHLVWSLKSGNVQGLLVAASLLALVLAETHPRWAGSLLAVAIAIKVWPAILLPWFLRPERRRALWTCLAASAVMWTLPVVWLGAGRYGSLLVEWFEQESQVGIGGREVWYPGQSLRGVLFRYLTDETRSLEPSQGYRDVHFASLPLGLVVAVWIALSAALYGWAAWRGYRAGAQGACLWDSAALVVFAMAQPFSNKASLVALLPAILVAGHLLTTAAKNSMARLAVIVAVSIAGLEIVLQSRSLQRLFEVLGVEFYLTLALLLALTAAAGQWASDSGSRS